MKTSAKIILPISLIVVIIGIISIASSYNNMQKAQQEANQAKQAFIKSCYDEKAGMLNPDLPTYAYQNNLARYNAVCATYSGALK
jgi:hypothetical protein